ncbi:putative response regulator receiver modulated diguanylate cyclase/phosphodiesterase with PAS/PAC sensor [Magnetofaba australis IT-1]|uniref:Putative response regulator receiver modulated diguanylate cyclase/phosphodiesterase with PAS/PAC sensor n=2 Tax=Magnetofaba TaxID=1472292 RepID=A0A1Y2K6Z7_9PROT|nr:putative response regulator receiver modulated diguanylate cyclase/phosphodiesterase with PAS/PAC sensor [Magnetofaba australis IT-1]
MVADDDPVTQVMLSRFLEKQGWRAMTVNDGESAVSAFDDEIPDMVLMDAKMPQMDGFEACRRIKQRPDARQTPVLMITGLNDDQSVDRAYEAGAVDFITKPIRWAILRNRMNYLLKMIEAERQLHLTASVFDNTSEGIVVTDAKGVVELVNPAFERITGYRLEEAVGHNISLLQSGRHDENFYARMWGALLEEGKWAGEIWNRRKNGEIYPEWANITAIKSPNEKINQYVAVFSDLTTIKESEENLLYIAGHDALTDLPNRLLFQERLAQGMRDASEHKRLLAVLVIDLDRFKVINETLGHDVGDNLLAAVSERLRDIMPPLATLARLGGDEFGVIAPQMRDSGEAAKLSHDILNVLSRAVIVGEMELYIGGSIGITVAPIDGDDPQQLMKNAEAAMYHAKQSGRNNFQFYRQELNTASVSRMVLEAGLRNAVDRQEFLLHYQPQMCLKRDKLIGVEALVRWMHPERGMVSPGEFIPLAEETGLVVPMGQWALVTACNQAVAWRNAGFPPIRVAVNLSGIQFKLPDFVDMVTRVVRMTGIEPACLELELTESIAMGDVEETLAKLKTLADLGVKLAIDDFGTGFSSLSYLKRFPIHTLKIDQSFVRPCTENSEEAAIVRSFVGLAHSLNLSVIAEGVETEAQREFLRGEACDEIQGYFYSRPLSSDALTDFLRAERDADKN